MHKSIKHLPILLLGTALSGCSMVGTGDYFADQYSQIQQQQQMPHLYGIQSQQSGCNVPTPCGMQPQPYAAAPSAPVYAQPVTPSAHAYGHAVAPQAYGQATYENANYSIAPYGAPSYARAPHGHSGRGLRRGYKYGELGVMSYDIDTDYFGGLARLGYQSASIFGAELEGTYGLTREKDTVTTAAGTSSSSIGIDHSLAGFAVARMPVSKKFNVLGRAGYHTTDSVSKSTDIAGVKTKTRTSDDGFAYGVGAEYALSPRTSLRADYTIYDYKGEQNGDAVALAIARKF